MLVAIKIQLPSGVTTMFADAVSTIDALSWAVGAGYRAYACRPATEDEARSLVAMSEASCLAS